MPNLVILLNPCACQTLSNFISTKHQPLPFASIFKLKAQTNPQLVGKTNCYVEFWVS